ncbi:MAG TPA: SDR family NAD(P)-dependent oxidoreductase, partial [Nitrospinota bacterium]|nr:SDR family NAD(P)-dependent oxidoreductase [Nitrospinota bacterium]
MAGSLAGQTVIITGGGRGFGEHMSRAVAKEGALVTVADRDAGEAERVVSDIEAEGGSAIAAGTDVTNEAQVKEMVGRTLERSGQIDVLVNNAGVSGPSCDYTEVTLEDWKAVY